MVKGHLMQLKWHPPLFCKFKHFNIKGTMVHHPVIKKGVNELLAKGPIEQLTGGAGFYLKILYGP